MKQEQTKQSSSACLLDVLGWLSDKLYKESHLYFCQDWSSFDVKW